MAGLYDQIVYTHTLPGTICLKTQELIYVTLKWISLVSITPGNPLSPGQSVDDSRLASVISWEAVSEIADNVKLLLKLSTQLISWYC